MYVPCICAEVVADPGGAMSGRAPFMALEASRGVDKR